jgi:hypothetical protein
MLSGRPRQTENLSLNEVKRGRGRPKHATVSVTVRFDPMDVELMDLRLAYEAEQAKARCSGPIHGSRADVVRAALQDCTLLGHRYPAKGPWRDRAEAIFRKYEQD